MNKETLLVLCSTLLKIGLLEKAEKVTVCLVQNN